MTKKEIYMALGTAIISFLSAVGGVFYGAELSQDNWEKQFEIEQRKAILDKRVELLDRMVTLFSKKPLIDGLRASLEAEKKIARSLERIEDLAREINELGSEMSSAMAMSAIYFGPETRAAVNDLNIKDPWAESDEPRQKVIDAMSREMQYSPVSP